MFGNLISAAIKVVASPIAVVKDVIDGEPFEATSEVLGSALDDITEIGDD